MGLMEIEFNQVMHTNFSLSLLNSSNIDIWVAPADNWHLDSENYMLGDLNLTWNVTNFNSTKMHVQLSFNKPAEISPNASNYDSIVVHFLNNNTFVSRNGGTLYESSIKI